VRIRRTIRTETEKVEVAERRSEKNDEIRVWKWQITAIYRNDGGYAGSKWKHGGHQSCY